MAAPSHDAGDNGEGPRLHRRAAVLCLALSLIAATVASASASSSEPPTGQPEAGNIGGSDQSTPSATNTDYTPRAQDGAGAGWTRVAGADFGATASHLTPFDADFYSLSFQDEQNGLVAGSRCQDPKDDPASCTRVPLIYRYLAPPGQLATLKEAYRGR